MVPPRHPLGTGRHGQGYGARLSRHGGQIDLALVAEAPGPGPAITYLKMLLSDWSTMKTALNVGMQHIFWASSDEGAPVGGAS